MHGRQNRLRTLARGLMIPGTVIPHRKSEPPSGVWHRHRVSEEVIAGQDDEGPHRLPVSGRVNAGSWRAQRNHIPLYTNDILLSLLVKSLKD